LRRDFKLLTIVPDAEIRGFPTYAVVGGGIDL
jgi:hypothetical protein